MKILSIPVLVYLLTSFSLSDDNRKEQFFFEAFSAEEIIIKEIALGSKVIDTVFKPNPVTIRHGNKLIVADGEPKFSFVRPQIGYLPLLVSYTFDSISRNVKEIYYDWEFERESKDYATKEKMWEREQGKLETYSKEYERIKKDLILALQLSNCDSDELNKKDGANGSEYWRRKCIWQLSNSEIEIYMIYASNTIRVRVHKKMSH